MNVMKRVFLRVSLPYIVLGSLWIIFTDKVLLFFTTNKELITSFQTLKGLFYVIFTAILLQLLVMRYVKELSKKQQREETLLEAVPDMLFKLTPEGVFIDYKSARDFQPLLPTENFIGKSIKEVLPEHISTLAMRALSLAIKTQEIQSFEYKLPTDGTLRDFEARLIPNKDSVSVIVRDITKLKQAESKLLEKERFLKDVLECIKDGISVLDKDMNILLVNSTMEKWYASEMPLVGKKCYMAYHRKNSPCEPCPAIRTLQNKGPEIEIVPFEAGGDLKGWLELYTYPFIDSQTGEIIGVIEYVRDITERVRAETEVKRLNRVFVMLSGINEAIIRIKDKNYLLNEACKIAVQKGGFRLAWIGFSDTEGFIRPVARYGFDDGYVDNLRISISENVPEGRGPTGSALREGRPFICDDIEKDESMLPWKDSALMRGYRSSAAFPIKVGGKTIGAFNLYSSERGFFNKEEIKLIEELTEDLSFALEKIDADEKKRQAEEELRKKVSELSDFYEMAVGREIKMKELKEKIERLEAEISRLRRANLP